MSVAHSCDGCSSGPLTQYKNNPVYQEITDEDNFIDNTRYDCIYIYTRRSKGYTDELEKINRNDSGIALTISLNEAAAKKSKIQNYRVFSSRKLALIIKQGLYHVMGKLQYF